MRSLPEGRAPQRELLPRPPLNLNQGSSVYPVGDHPPRQECPGAVYV